MSTNVECRRTPTPRPFRTCWLTCFFATSRHIAVWTTTTAIVRSTCGSRRAMMNNRLGGYARHERASYPLLRVRASYRHLSTSSITPAPRATRPSVARRGVCIFYASRWCISFVRRARVMKIDGEIPKLIGTIASLSFQQCGRDAAQ